MSADMIKKEQEQKAKGNSDAEWRKSSRKKPPNSATPAI